MVANRTRELSSTADGRSGVGVGRGASRSNRDVRSLQRQSQKASLPVESTDANDDASASLVP